MIITTGSLKFKKISSQKFKPKISDILFIVRGDSNRMYDYYKNDI